MRIKRMVKSGALAVMLVLSMVLAAVPVTFAEAAKGPAKGDESYAYICFFNDDGTNQTYLYISDFMKKMQEEQGTTPDIGKVKGATYNKKKNTLTLNGYNKPAMYIGVNMMGDDFKIELKGTNSICNLSVYGDNYGGSVTITGNGSLTCNKNKKAAGSVCGSGIFMGAENTKSTLVIEKTCTVTSYGNTYYGYEQNEDGEYVDSEIAGHPIYVFAHPLKNASKVIKAKGKVTGGKYKVVAWKNENALYDIYCTADKFVSKKK